MAYVKVRQPIEVYHLTQKGNLDRILDDGVIRRFNDTECWFCESLDKMKAYMEQTVLCEGKPYYAVGGQICRYPKFVPEDYVILKLVPCGQEGNWYRWNQEVPPGSSKELIQAAKEFSQLKIGYRGDLAFKDAEIIDVPQFVRYGAVRKLPALTEGELRYNLGEKLKDCWDTYKNSLLTLSAEELIKRAEEIAAMQVCYSKLCCIESSLDSDLCSFLLQRGDPLSALSEAWMAHQNVDVGEALQSLLDDLCRDGSNQVRKPAHQTVKELLEAYPQDNFQLMTPSGFVDLTPNETEMLLRGEAVMAHPGASGYELPVPAEEILELEIETLKQGEDGHWYALVDTPAQQMDASEQGFQMNM